MLRPAPCEIAIVDADPVGLFLANLLGARFAAVNARWVEPGTTVLKTTDEMFVGWMRRCRASGEPVRSDRFIAETPEPGRIPACLGLFRPMAGIGPHAMGEAV